MSTIKCVPCVLQQNKERSKVWSPKLLIIIPMFPVLKYLRSIIIMFTRLYLQTYIKTSITVETDIFKNNISLLFFAEVDENHLLKSLLPNLLLWTIHFSTSRSGSRVLKFKVQLNGNSPKSDQSTLEIIVPQLIIQLYCKPILLDLTLCFELLNLCVPNKELSTILRFYYQGGYKIRFKQMKLQHHYQPAIYTEYSILSKTKICQNRENLQIFVTYMHNIISLKNFPETNVKFTLLYLSLDLQRANKIVFRNVLID
ncbi:hypothetical protein AGLY_003863 [Aphis glycines]|uniref:Uncharacterized protein n=1 Tax=Aphis glycines TaxID=307491 RepID=A0A6G0TZJ8_APHGL|nr:hypothetical protein AGLY_003863 [Aphis glycines]